MNDYKSWLAAFNPDFPTEFSQALSYYEEMKRCYELMREFLHYMKEHEAEVMAEVNRIITEKLKNINQQIQNSVDELDAELSQKIEALDKELKGIIEAQITSVRGQIVNLAESMNRFEVETDERFINILRGQEALTQEIQAQIESLAKEMSSFESQIYMLENNFNSFKGHILGMFDAETKKLINKIDEQIARIQGDRILVTNPLSGKREGLGKVLQEIAEYKMPYPLTMDEYAALNITADEYAAMNITFNEFRDRAGLIFLPRRLSMKICPKFQNLDKRITKLEDMKWLSGISMDAMEPYDAYLELLSFVLKNLFNPITADNYAARAITVDSMEGLNITAEEFALKANSLLPYPTTSP